MSMLALALGCSSIDVTPVESKEPTDIPDVSSWRIPGHGKVRTPSQTPKSTHRVTVPFLSPQAYDVARSRLTDLDIKGKAPMTGYDRDEFGTEWSDAVGDFGWTRERV